MEIKKFQIEIQHDMTHDRYVGKVVDADGHVLVSVDTLESRVFFSALVNVLKNNV